VRYTSELLRRLTSDLGKLSAIERFNLVGDTWAAVVAGLTSVGDFLGLARLFRAETDRNVWIALIGAFGYLHRMLAEERRAGLHAMVRELVGPSVEQLGWSPAADEGPLTRQLRGTLIGALGTLGEDPPTQERAAALHARFVDDRTAIDPDVVPAVINIVAHTGRAAEYEQFTRRYKTAPTPQEEQRYLFSLAGFEHRDLVRRTLDATLTDEIRTQNAPFLIGSLLHNLVGGDLAWEFVKSHWDFLIERFPDNTHVRMLEGITALSTPELATDVEEFFKTHTVSQGQKTLEQHLERLRINLQFRRREADVLARVF
jgi:puromycin-sensitive aminopeptidase